MEIVLSQSRKKLGEAAAKHGATLIRESIALRGAANIIVATGTSQFEMLQALVREHIDWSLIHCFHLDEYLGIPITHPASFRKYLKERLVDRVHPLAFHYINSETEPEKECARLGKLISTHPIDVAFVGIGENAHLAFNDPPADFEAQEAYLKVNLDRACRSQQVSEGWFASLSEVPTQAISMSIRQIMKSKSIVCSVPDKRKASAVAVVVNGPVTPSVPASILQEHPDAWLFLEPESGSLLGQTGITR
jgi:glucosamine-6-phosphate deaminase